MRDEPLNLPEGLELRGLIAKIVTGFQYIPNPETGEGLAARLTILVPDATEPAFRARLVDVYVVEYFPDGTSPLAMFETLLRQALDHEFGEGLWRDGKPIHEPHPELQVRRPRGARRP